METINNTAFHWTSLQPIFTASCVWGDNSINQQYSHLSLCHSPRLPALDEYSTKGKNILLTQRDSEGDQAAGGGREGSTAHLRPPTSLLPTYVMAANLQMVPTEASESVSHRLPGRPHSKMEQEFKDPAMIPHPGTPRNSLRREACEHRREKSPLNGALS